MNAVLTGVTSTKLIRSSRMNRGSTAEEDFVFTVGVSDCVFELSTVGVFKRIVSKPTSNESGGGMGISHFGAGILILMECCH